MSDEPIPQTAVDAPLSQRSLIDAWVTDVPLRPPADGDVPGAPIVLAAGRPALPAPGSRDLRAAAAVGGLDSGQRANWIPTGPRNVPGRIRALAVHPTNSNILYAGLASGGVWQSSDGGETWSTTWPSSASPSIGGIAICHDHPETIWVATGEHLSQILGNGVYRSTDSGATWTNAANPAIPGAGAAVTFDAIAAHPTNAAHCWAVGLSGIYRTLDGGQTWTQFSPGVYHSDVAYSVSSGGNPVVFLVRGVSGTGEATVLRIDNPDDPDAAIVNAIAAAASSGNPIPPPGAPAPQPTRPGRGKIAICSGTPDVAYVRFAQAGTDGNGGGHAGLIRAQNAQSAASGSVIVWETISPAGAPDFAGDVTGGYALAIGVNGANPDELVTGMIDVFVSQNANHPLPLTFKRVTAQDLNPVLDPAQHADHHATLIAPPPPGAPGGTPPTLWVANDGGLSRSLDWQTAAGYPAGATLLPLPDGVVSWRKCFGMTGSQMYSLAQSPLTPSAFGCGFQDNGVMFTAGGLTWRFLISGDGGFVAFDPDDPFKLLATWQREIDEVEFPGRLIGAFPPPGTSAGTGLWPRPLQQGFLQTDTPLFVADTAHHPRRGDRVLHARANRLYGSTETTGDAWRPEGAGRGVEIQLTVPPNTTGTLQVLPSSGGPVLGFPPQIATTTAAAQPAVASIRSLLPGPYALQDGNQLNLQVTLVPAAGPAPAVPPTTTFTFNRTADKHGVPWTVAEVAAVITGPQLAAYPVFWPRPSVVEITTNDVGGAAQITLGGTALNAPAGGLSPLGVRGRVYQGSANRPASVTLIAPNIGIGPQSTMAVAGGGAPLQLTIAIGANGATGTITFDTDTFVDLNWIHAGELQRVIHNALQSDPATVTALAVTKRLRIAANAGHTVTLGGTAAVPPALGVGLNFAFPVGAPVAAAEMLVAQANSFNLFAPGGGAALALTINDGAAQPTLTFTGTENDLRAISAEEVQARIQKHFTDNHVNATCDIEYLFPAANPNGPGPSEVVYSRSTPDTAWVGGMDGTLYKTTNDGGRWDTIQDPLVYGLDRSIEAIAIHPTDANTIYVGLEGRPTSGIADKALTKPGLIFKTTDGGSTWSHVGGDVKDANNGLLGAYALQIDTGAPDTVFAATEVGVFRTTNGGSSWQPFNEGLPNALVRDLDFVPERRVLRAGLWGRGTFERHVGDVVPKDVSLYVRASEFDDGSTRPPPRGPDLYASQPRTLRSTVSPDIKNSRDIPPSLANVTTIDGVAFDLDVVHEDPVHDAAGSILFVQVHNRGSFAGTAVRIACLWADVSTGPPRLPDNFWTTFHGGALAGTVGGWTVIHDTRADAAGAVRNVAPGYPVVQRFAVAWPNDISSHRKVGILVLVECAEDPLAATQVDVGELLAAEPKSAYRETGTVQDRNDQIILIRGTSTAQFTVSAPGGPLAAVGSILPGGVAPTPATPIGPMSSAASPQQATFAFAAGQALAFSTPPQVVTISFGAGIGAPATATAREVMNVITSALLRAGAPLAVNSAGAAGAQSIQLRGGAGSVFQVTGGSAAPNLGLAVGGDLVPFLQTGTEPFNLSAGGPETLTLSIVNQATVHFAKQADFDPATPQPARAVRRVLNRSFAAATLPVRAVTPRVDLWIRRSITDIDGIPSPVAGRHLADIVASAAVVAPANQPALFDLVTVHANDRVTAATDNLLYLRVANLGNTDLAAGDSRHSLYALAIAASPITWVQIAPVAGVNQAVPAGSSTTVEFHWNPGAASPGDRLFVLAVADDRTNNPLAVPATFASVDVLDAFCASNPSAAYRMFVVGP